MIRNACVNDGTAESGQEVRNADLLADYLAGAGIDIETFETAPGRTSLVTRIEGTDPDAPRLCLMGHTDVVPVTPEGWDRDPFGGELIGDEIWGRGAVDMLNLTSSMAVAFRHLVTPVGATRATSCSSPSPTKRPAAPTALVCWPRSALGPSALRLRAHRVRRHPGGGFVAVDHRREGCWLAPSAREGHAGSRFDALSAPTTP